LPDVKVRDMAKVFDGLPRGTWVMLSRDEEHVLSRSLDFEEAIRIASEKGEENPLITRVPLSDGSILFL
jgi:hypothetical protein